MDDSCEANDNAPEYVDCILVVAVGVAAACPRLGAGVGQVEESIVWDYSVVELLAFESGVDFLDILER